MLLVYLMLFLIVLLVEYIRHKRFVAPNTLFTFMWTFFPGLSSLGLYNIYKPSILIHVLVVVTVLVFNIAYSFFTRSENEEHNDIIFGNINRKALIIANLVSFLYLSFFLSKAIAIIRDFGFDYLRTAAFDSSMGLANTAELVIITWGIQALFIATIIFGVIDSIVNKKHLLLIIAIIGIILYTILFVGRYLLVELVFSYIIAFVTAKKHINKEIRFNKYMVTAALALIMLVTSLRSFGDFNMVKSSVIYYSGSFTYLDNLLSSGEYVNNYLYGFATFGFILDIFLAPLTFLFKVDFIGASNTISQITSTPRFISPNQTYNAMATMLYSFIFDFGFLGVLLGTLFVSGLSALAFNRIKNRMSYFSLGFYLFMMFVLFDSVMSYQLLFAKRGFAIIFLFLFTKRGD